MIGVYEDMIINMGYDIQSMTRTYTSYWHMIQHRLDGYTEKRWCVGEGSVNDFSIPVAQFSSCCIRPNCAWSYCTWQGVQLIPTQLDLCR